MSENNNKEDRYEKLPEVEINMRSEELCDTVVDDDGNIAEISNGGEAVATKGKFARWIENFFYHYKWHTAAVAFILIVAIVCTVTMCGRKKADVQIVYAGSMEISSNKQGKDTSTYQTLLNGLESVAEKGDNKTVVSLAAYWWLSKKEITALNSDDNEDNDISAAQETNIYSGFENFDSLMMLGASSKYYVWFMSPSLYDYYAAEANKFTEVEDGDRIEMLFTNLGYLRESNSTVQYYDNKNFTAIKLSSLSVYYNTELNMLPEDTLVVLRAPTGLSNKTSKKAFEASSDYLFDLVNY